LALASVIALSVFFVVFHANGLPEDQKYSFAAASYTLGFLASALALALSLVGSGSVCLPASLAALGLAALWIIAAISY
jgi:predicted permease